MTAYMKTEIFEAYPSSESKTAHGSRSGLTTVCLFSCTGLIVTALLYLLGFGAELNCALAAG
jgi:hypothetical protein